MTTRTIATATLLCALASTAHAAPTFTVVPGGVQAGNWVWDIDITPDLTLVPDNSGTPVAVEFGFRLSGAELISAGIADPAAFDTANPGAFIFGWETPDPQSNNRPYGLQTNLALDEIFVAYGSGNFTTPGPKHFLKVITSGPSNGPSSFSSTIQWLGAYGTGSSNGRITQITGLTGSTYQTANFDIFSGSATQAVPEPASAAIIGLAATVMTLGLRRRRHA